MCRLTRSGAEVAAVDKPRWVGLDRDSWGIDHGTWSVLVHVYPKADVPVVQLSINALKPLDYHFDLGRAWHHCEQGVLILGSGNVVHNLGRIDWERARQGIRLGSALRRSGPQIMSSVPRRYARSTNTPTTVRRPTPDHFIPLLYIAGLAADGGRGAPAVVVDGYAYGSLSMTCFTA